MKKLTLQFLFIFLALFAQKSNAQTVDLSLTLAEANSSNSFVIPFGDSVNVFFKITNHGPDDLDTTDYVLYGTDLIPPNYALVAEDTATSGKKYLIPGDFFIDQGLLFVNSDSTSTSDTTFEFCFYLLDDFGGSPFYSDPNASNDTLCFNVNYKANPMGIAKNKNVIKASSFPNPVKDKMEILLEKPLNEIAKINVYNSLGQVVLQSQIEKGLQKAQIDMQHFATGMYTIQLITHDGSSSLKCIKQ